MCKLASKLWSAQLNEPLRRLDPRKLLSSSPHSAQRLTRADISNAGKHDRYDIFNSLRDNGVHVKLPIEEDSSADTEEGRFSHFLQRAIAEFVDRAQGGEGGWALPKRIPDREECRGDRGYRRVLQICVATHIPCWGAHYRKIRFGYAQALVQYYVFEWPPLRLRSTSVRED
ncbi:hypothetical protein B0H16DRAFT_1464121 [Mycena metata]|uniref:Uncharacterized protein n=1 Tax=Mycena metata TaxID=1033252 RepID=A0AAD7IG51_9AGAR|nr:hypothetical protein B0H16DRAFT_1464121 [Mycena metata]